MDLLLGLGRGVVHVVLFVAGLVKSEASPGLVALGLVIALVILASIFSIKCARKIKAVKWILKEIRQNSKGEKFGNDITEITRAIRASANDEPKKHLESAWVNYRGTFIIEDKKKRIVSKRSLPKTLWFMALHGLPHSSTPRIWGLT